MTIYQDSKRIVKLSTDTVETPTIDDNFSTNNYSVTGSNIAVTNNEIQYSSSNDDSRLYRTITDIGNQDFVIDWVEKVPTGGTNHVYDPVVVAENNTRMYANSTNDGYTARTITKSGTNAVISPQQRISGTMTEGSQSTSYLTQGSTYYMRLSLDGTTLRQEAFSDADRTVSVAFDTITATAIPNLVSLQHGSQTTGSTLSNAVIDSLKVYYNISSVSSKPTDVQDNTILVEKDLGRRFWFESELAPTYEDDFTSDNSVDQDASKISVNTAQERWDFNIVNDQTNDSSSIDITTALSDTNWVMDFDYTWTSLSGTTNVNTSFFGISNSNGTVPSQTAQDHIGVRLQTGSGFSITGCHSNNGTMQSGLSATFTTIPSVTTLYFRIVRTSTTSMTVKIYTTSARTTVSEEKTVAVSASTTGLRYVKISPYEGTNGGSNTEVGYVKNLKIYNAVSTPTPATWTRNDSSMYKSTALTNAMTVGGISSAWQAITSVNNWNGSAWTSGTAISPSQGLTMYRGNTDSGINCGGFSGTAVSTGLNKCQTWDGSSWVTKTSMNNRRAVGFGLGGTEDSAFATGGQDGSGGTQYLTAEKYDGSANTWATTPPPNSTYGGQGSMGAGDPEDYVNSGNQNSGGSGSSGVIETWNGTTWTTLPSSSNFTGGTPYNYGSCCGVGNDSYMQGINSDTTGTARIYKFDGSAWTDSGSATTAPKYVGMGGDSSSAIICGAWSNGTSSSYYDGTTWTTTTALQTGRAGNGTGATT